MSTIANKFKKWASAWGIEPKGHTIEDTVENIVDNLPFGVKTETVEIIPEQSVTYYNYYDGAYSCASDAINIISAFEVGKTYSVVINGNIRKATCVSDTAVIMGNGWLWSDTEENTGEDFCVRYQGRGEYVIYWSEKYGETITIAIYEEQQIVKQLDPKFVGASGGGGVININFTLGEDGTITADKTPTEVIGLLYTGVLVQGVFDNEGFKQIVPFTGFPSIDSLFFTVTNAVIATTGELNGINILSFYPKEDSWEITYRMHSFVE